MSEFDSESFAEQIALLGLLGREEIWEAQRDSEDGSLEALTRTLLRKGMLTSWQIDRLLKGDVSGFFYGGYKVLFHIAEGTFARVYRGRKVHGDQPVAIKVLRHRFSSDPSSVERFNREAEAGMKLVHPNVVRIFDYGAQDNRHYMIMEYVEGSNLRDFLKFRKRLDQKEAMPLFLGLAHGLQYSLRQGITHRDIKGTNILIGSSGTAKLVDFGLATIEGEERKMAIAHGQRTVDYSALERTCGSAKGDPRSDIYFLGCVFYQMLTGQLPLPEVETSDPLAKMLKRSFGAIRPLAEMPHTPDPELCRIIEKMMKVELRLRYQSMDEVVNDLEAYYAQFTGAPLPTNAEESDSEDEFDLDDAFVRPVGEDEDDKAGQDLDDDFELPVFQPKRVLCVEAQDQIQDAFRKGFSKLGYRVLLVGSAELATERYDEANPDVVVFDLDGLGSDGLSTFLEMHEQALESGNDLSAVVLVGPRQTDLIPRLPNDERLIILTKPIKMKDVQDALTQLVPAQTS